MDFYGEISTLIDRLNAEGCTAAASELREAMIAGSTGTEIVMAIRHRLVELRKSRAYSSETLSLASAIRKEADRLLRSSD